MKIPFTPFKIFNPVVLVREATQVEILPNVGLPTDLRNMPIGKRITNLVQGSKQTNKDIVSFALDKELDARMGAYYNADVEKPLSKTVPFKRPESIRSLYTYAINNILKVDSNDADPAEGYLYFGNSDFKRSLPMLCQSNPFFASALTVSEGGEHLELMAFADHPERVEEPLYLSLMRELTDDVHRINVKFDKSMDVVEISKLDSDSGEAVAVPEEEWNYYASGVMYNLLFYSSTIHANIHILHYLMCACIVQSTRGTNESMEKWADIYDDNIAIKYLEVAALLFESTVAGRPLDLTGPGKKLVSGKDGFGATPKVMKKVTEMQFLWGSLKNTEEFTKKFLHKGVYMTAKSEEAAEKILEEAGILTEFNKHRDNVPKFAEALTAAMKEDDLDAFKKTEEKIKSFMAACGKGVSSIDSVSSWLQLMSMTGLVHGSTLSYTRIILAPEIIRWRNIHNPKWDEDDYSLISGGFGTLQGMTLDRHVFTSKIEHGWKWDTEDIAEKVKAVLTEFDSKASQLKTKYEEELEARDDLREYGWILTDHCNDGYDGKQHTITTYI